jgi:hypothetical protein
LTTRVNLPENARRFPGARSAVNRRDGDFTSVWAVPTPTVLSPMVEYVFTKIIISF